MSIQHNRDAETLRLGSAVVTGLWGLLHLDTLHRLILNHGHGMTLGNVLMLVVLLIWSVGIGKFWSTARRFQRVGGIVLSQGSSVPDRWWRNVWVRAKKDHEWTLLVSIVPVGLSIGLFEVGQRLVHRWAGPATTKGSSNTLNPLGDVRSPVREALACLPQKPAYWRLRWTWATMMIRNSYDKIGSWFLLAESGLYVSFFWVIYAGSSNSQDILRLNPWLNVDTDLQTAVRSLSRFDDSSEAMMLLIINSGRLFTLCVVSGMLTHRLMDKFGEIQRWSGAWWPRGWTTNLWFTRRGIAHLWRCAYAHMEQNVQAKIPEAYNVFRLEMEQLCLQRATAQVMPEVSGAPTTTRRRL